MIKRFINSIVLCAFLNQVFFISNLYACFDQADYIIEKNDNAVSIKKNDVVLISFAVQNKKSDDIIHLFDEQNQPLGLKIHNYSDGLVVTSDFQNDDFFEHRQKFEHKQKIIRFVASQIHIVGKIYLPHKLQISSNNLSFYGKNEFRNLVIDSTFVNVNPEAIIKAPDIFINASSIENHGDIQGDNGKIIADHSFIDKGAISVELNLQIPNPYKIASIGCIPSNVKPYNFCTPDFLFALQQTMGQKVGVLSFEGKTGAELVRYLCTNGIVGGKDHFQSMDAFVCSISKPALVMVVNPINKRQEPHFVVPSNFMTKSQANITANNISIITTGDQKYTNIKMFAEKIYLKGKNISIATSTYRTSKYQHSNQGFTHITQELSDSKSEIKSKDTTIEAHNNITLKGVDLEGTKKLQLNSGNYILIEDKPLYQDSYTYEKSKKGFESFQSHQVTDIVRNTLKGEKIELKAKQGIESYGGIYSGEEIIFDSNYNSFQAQKFQNTFTEQKSLKRKSRQRENVYHSQTQTTFNSSVIATRNLTLKGDGCTVMKGAKIYAENLIDEGKRPLQVGSQIGENSYYYEKNIKNLLSKTRQGSRGSKEVECQSQLHLKKIIRSNSGDIIFENTDISGIDIQGTYKQTTKHLKSWEESWCKTKSVIPPKVIPVIQLVVALATNSLIPGGGVILNNALSTLISQATATFAQTGNIEHVGKSLIEKKSLRNLLIQVAGSSITDAIADKLGFVNPAQTRTYQDFVSQTVKTETLRGLVNTGLNMGIRGDDLGSALENAGKSGLVNVLAASGAKGIGNFYGSGNLDYLTHKFLHGLNGAVTGMILDGKDGAIAGAIGAITAEVMMDDVSKGVVESFKDKSIEYIHF